MNWYRNFVPNFSFEISDWTEKTKSNSKFYWSNQDEIKKQEIFQRIVDSSVLVHADYDAPFTLQSDASDIGIGSVLLQNNLPTGFYSKKLSGSELHYTIVEK